MATETDKVNTGALGTLVAVGLFATLSIVLGVDALVRYETAQLSAERASHASEGYRSLAAEQNAKLTAQPKWSDQSKGLVSMPISDAMTRVVADLKQDPLSASPLPPPAAGTQTAVAPDAGAPTAPGTGEAQQAPEGTAAPSAAPPASAGRPPSPAPAPKSPAAPEAPRPTGSLSPKTSTVLAVPAAPPAPPRPAPAPTAPAPSDG